MALELKQQVKLSQQLVMTPQLQQAIKLLQLSRMELVGLVQHELEENPVLEEVADSDEERADEASAEPEAEQFRLLDECFAAGRSLDRVPASPEIPGEQRAA